MYMNMYISPVSGGSFNAITMGGFEGLSRGYGHPAASLGLLVPGGDLQLLGI